MKKILVSALAVSAVAVVASGEARAEGAPLVLSTAQLDEVKGGQFDNSFNQTISRVRGNVIRGNNANTSNSGDLSSVEGGIFVLDNTNNQTFTQTSAPIITITVGP